MQVNLRRICDIFELEKGSLQSSKCTAGKFNFVTASAETKTHNTYTHECEALIIAVAASGSLGRVHYISGKFIASDLCFILTPKPGLKVDLRLYFHYLNSIREKLVAATATGTSKKAINLGNLSKFQIPYFDFAKQVSERERIDFCLHRSKTVETNYTENLSLVRNLRANILQLALQGKLVPQNSTDEPASALLKRIEAEKKRLVKEGKIKATKPISPISKDKQPFSLPHGWKWVRFEEIIDPKYAISYGVLVPGEDYPNGIPFVRLADLDLKNPPKLPEKSISPDIDQQYERTRLEGGEILMGVVGSIGKLGIAPDSWKGANIARAICRIVPSKELHKGFLIKLLASNFMQSNFKGDTRTLAQPTLNIGLIRSSYTPLPPLAEQERIVSKVDELMTLCDQLEARIIHTQTLNAHLMDSLIHRITEAA